MRNKTHKYFKSILIFTFIFTFISHNNIYGLEEYPDIKGDCAITMDIDTNEIIYSKNIDTQTYPASITKLLTAILLEENMKPEDELVYTKNAKYQEPISFNFNIYPIGVGKTMNAKNAMDSLLLRSCNDIASMISDNISNVQAYNASDNIDDISDLFTFSDLMNMKSRQLGMNNSNFVTPNGLDTDIDNHLSTAYDIALLAKAAYEHPWVRKTINKKYSTVSTTKGYSVEIKNSNKLLGNDGCIGGKTGFTTKAQRCLTTIFERNGRHIVGVILKSPRDYPYDKRIFNNMKKIIDWSYTAKKSIYLNANSNVKTLDISYDILPFTKLPYANAIKTTKIPLIIKNDIKLYNTDVSTEKVFDVKNINLWNLDKNNPIGTMTLTQKSYSQTCELYPTINSKDIFINSIPNYLELISKSLFMINTLSV